MHKYFIILLLVLLNYNNLFTQSKTKINKTVDKNEGKNAIAIGLSTNRVFGISAESMYSTDDAAATNGSFNGAQPGMDLRYTMDIDEEGSFRIPIGFNYEFFSARERIPISRILDIKLEHTLNIISPYVGVEYRFFKLPKARAYVYGGFDLKASFITNAKYTQSVNNINTGQNESQGTASKENAMRFGTTYRIGIEGEISDNYEINVSSGLNVLNLIGKDGNRGELLTPIPRSSPISSENQESIVYGLFFSILLQYRF